MARKEKIKKYIEEDRTGLVIFGVTGVEHNAALMSLDDLVFWLGLGILLARKYVLKATHDKITAYPPNDGQKLPLIERVTLRRCGWHKDTDNEDDPCAWFSFHAGG
jgi:hypothetical protein